MSTLLPEILENTRWRIGQIVPTDRPAVLFRDFDALKVKPAPGSGWLRLFSAVWQSSGADLGTTNSYQRTSDHQVLVSVYYPLVLGEQELRDLIVRDRHSLAKQLRDERLYRGTSDGNPTEDLHLMLRLRQRDSLQPDGPGLWRLDMTWRVTAQEIL